MIYKREFLIGAVACLAAFPSAALAGNSVNDIIKGLAPIQGQTDAGGYAAKKRDYIIVDDQEIYIDFTRSMDFEVFFEFGSSRLTPEARATIDTLGEALMSPQMMDFSYLIAGHTDAVGSASSNRRLSGLRAAAVRRYLIENFPIRPSRLVVIGFGEERLKLPDQPTAALNRRVEVALIVKP